LDRGAGLNTLSLFRKDAREAGEDARRGVAGRE